MLADIDTTMAITGRYMCSVRIYSDNNGEVHM